MFDILVYLYETYYRPDACPEPEALARKLSAVGFDDVEISEALDWLNGLTEMAGTTNPALNPAVPVSMWSQEVDTLGTAAIGFIQFLELAKPAHRLAARDRHRTRAGAGRIAGHPGQAEDHHPDAAVEPGQGAGRADVRRPVRPDEDEDAEPRLLHC
jgi:hypothetical protein